VASVHVLHPRASLGPHELHIASEAFDAALQAVDGPLAAMPPERVRDILAKYIAERALMGERDPETLRDGALECLSLMARSGVFSGASARRIEFVPGTAQRCSNRGAQDSEGCADRCPWRWPRCSARPRT